MKLTKETLKRIIKEELEAVLNEGPNSPGYVKGYAPGGSKYNLGDKAEKQRTDNFKSQQGHKQAAADNTRAMQADAEFQEDVESAYQYIKNLKFRSKTELEDAIKDANKKRSEDSNFIEAVAKKFAAAQQSKKDSAASNAAFKSSQETGKNLRKVLRWLKETSKTSWKKDPNSSSQQEFEKKLESLRGLDLEELSKYEETLQELLLNIGNGNEDLYNSITKGRTGLEKLGGMFKRGKFAEE